MSDIGSDYEAQLHMMMKAYKKLRAEDPTNPLLQMVTAHPDDGGFDFHPGYTERFSHPDDRHRIQGYIRYTFALEAALRGKPVDLDAPCPREF